MPVKTSVGRTRNVHQPYSFSEAWGKNFEKKERLCPSGAWLSARHERVGAGVEYAKGPIAKTMVRARASKTRLIDVTTNHVSHLVYGYVPTAWRYYLDLHVASQRTNTTEGCQAVAGRRATSRLQIRPHR